MSVCETGVGMVCVRICVTLMLQHPQDSLQRLHSEDATASGADAGAEAGACAAAATHPLSFHCTELPPLPPSFCATFPPSLLHSPPLPALSHTDLSRSPVLGTVGTLALLFCQMSPCSSRCSAAFSTLFFLLKAFLSHKVLLPLT